MEKDKFVGICKVGEKGQIVIPAQARKMFNINPGDSIIVLCDKEKGIALVKSDIIEDFKRRFEINSDEIMVVGDTNTDMQFAKNGGALAVGVLSGVGEKEELKESADFIIADVGQLMYNWKNIEIQESR